MGIAKTLAGVFILAGLAVPGMARAECTEVIVTNKTSTTLTVVAVTDYDDPTDDKVKIIAKDVKPGKTTGYQYFCIDGMERYTVVAIGANGAKYADGPWFIGRTGAVSGDLSEDDRQ